MSIALAAPRQGGRAQAWIVSQILPDAVDPSQSLETILYRPRWVVGDRDLGQPELSLVAEPGVAADTLARAAEDGLPVVRFSGPADEVGRVQLVRRAGGIRFSASDSRADGIGAVIHSDIERGGARS